MLNVHPSIVEASASVQLLCAAAAPPISAAGGAARCGPESESPVGNTGDKLTKGLDWLNATFPAAALSRVRVFVESYLGPAVNSDRGCNTYAQACRWETGAVLDWTDGRAECWLSLNAGSLALVPVHGLQMFLLALRELGAKCTRVDLRVDVPRSRLNIGCVVDAARAGHYRRFNGHRIEEGGERGGGIKGMTVYFGRRGRDGSGRFVRVYDKYLESGGEIDAVRFELEASGDVAELCMVALVSSFDQQRFEWKIGEITTGAIDFVDADGAHGHVDRMRRLGWWQSIIDEVGSCTFSVHRDPVPLQRTLEWGAGVLAGKLALAYEVVESQGVDGDQFITEYVRAMLARGRRALDVGRVGGAVFLGIDVAGLLEVIGESRTFRRG